MESIKLTYAILMFFLSGIYFYLIFFPLLISLDFHQFLGNGFKKNNSLITKKIAYYFFLFLIYIGCVFAMKHLVMKGAYNIYTYEYQHLDGIKGLARFNFGEYNDLIIKLSRFVYEGVIISAFIVTFLKTKFKEKIVIFDVFNLMILVISLVTILRIMFLRVLTGFNIEWGLGYIFFIIFIILLIFKRKTLITNEKLKIVVIFLTIYFFLTVFNYDISDVHFYIKNSILFFTVILIPMVFILLVNNTESKIWLIKLSFYFLSFGNAIICAWVI